MPRPSEAQFRDAPVYRLYDEPDGDLGEPVRAVREAEAVWLQGGGAMPASVFDALAVRCAADGTPVIPVAAGLTVQRHALSRAAGEGLVGHLEDVDALRQAAGPVEGMSVPSRMDAHLHDAIRSATRDPVLPQQAIGGYDPFVEAAEDVGADETQTPDMVLARIEVDTGIDAGRWVEVKRYPTYMIEPIRAAARQMLAPVLGNTASLEDLRRLEVPLGEVERYNALMRWMRDAGEVRTLPVFRHPSMPGYVTSEPMLGELNGVTLLVFKDFKAAYAYAWQTDPDHAPKVPVEPEEPPPFGFGR